MKVSFESRRFKTCSQLGGSNNKYSVSHDLPQGTFHTHTYAYTHTYVPSPLSQRQPETRISSVTHGARGLRGVVFRPSTLHHGRLVICFIKRWKEGRRKEGRKEGLLYIQGGRKEGCVYTNMYIYIYMCVCVCVPVDDTVDWSRPDCSSEANVFENNARFISRTWSSRLRRKSRSLGGGSFKSSVRPSCQKSVVSSYKGQKSLIADLGLKIQKGWFEGRFFLGKSRIGQNIAARCAFMFSTLRFFFPRSSASTASIRRYVGSSEADVFERIANTVNVIIVKIEKYTFWRLLQKNDAPKMCGQRRIHTHCSLISDGEREEH